MNARRSASHARHGRAVMAATLHEQAMRDAEQAAQDRARRAEAAQAERDRPRLTYADVAGARLVRDRYGWHEVVRVSAKSVTVKTAWSWTERIPLDRVLEVRA